jgi:hypothetical protein
MAVCIRIGIIFRTEWPVISYNHPSSSFGFIALKSLPQSLISTYEIDLLGWATCSHKIYGFRGRKEYGLLGLRELVAFSLSLRTNLVDGATGYD